MRIKHFAIILLCFLFASCSPEAVKQMPKEEVKEENTKAVAIATGASLEIKFKPVAFAKSYAYSISSLSDGEIQEGITPIYDDGYYIFNVDITDITDGDVTVYASASDKNQNWTKIATANFVTTLVGAPIDAYISRRNENTAEIRINTTLSSENIEYRVILDGDALEDSRYEIKDHIITINGLDADKSYDIVIQHALKNEMNFDENEVAKLTIEPYNPNVYSSALNINLSSDGKYFEIDNITSHEITTLDLYKRESANSTKSDLVYSNIRVENGKAKVPFSALNSLESGYFYVSGTDDSRNVYISNIIKYTTPMILKGSTVNYKSAILEFDFANDIDTDSLAFSISGDSSATVSMEDGKIIIKGLESNTDYGNRLSIKPTNTEYSAVAPLTLNNLETKSFAGDNPETGKSYEWGGKFKGETEDTNFRIYVKEAPEGSSFNYYVYFSKDDAAIIGTEYEKLDLRISPLIDESNDELGMPDTMGISVNSPGKDHEQANNAYTANGNKWNSMKRIMSPQRWYINSCTPRTDNIITSTWTSLSENSAPSKNYETVTSFSFMEYEDNNGETKPVIKFQNKGSFLVNLGLYTNSNPNEGKTYGDNTGDEYCFYLTEREGN